jgi:integrative and conjugative element protein (TIGR02256 family)
MPGDRVIWLARGARLAIEREACRHRLQETGGPLFGYEGADGSVVIDAAEGPGPRARHGRFRYSPDREAIARAIERLLAASGGERYLVGEWHSHPLGHARASARDRRSVQAMSEDEELALVHPVALIQATSPWGRRVRPAELTAWSWEADTGAVVEGKVAVYTSRIRGQRGRSGR